MMNASKKTYSSEYHTTHHFDLPINYADFSKKSVDIHNKTHTPQQIFFLYPFGCNQYVLKKIIALNFISKTHDSEQLITKNPQRTKKKKSTNLCLINKILQTKVRAQLFARMKRLLHGNHGCTGVIMYFIVLYSFSAFTSFA